jgi:hypothetical protein
MRNAFIALSLAILVGGGVATAMAQQRPAAEETKELKRQDSVPPATGRNLPEQAGTTEPSSKVPGTGGHEGVLERGVLSVPGAPSDVDTAPAKFSSRTDADDQLPIAAYRLRGLDNAQRQEIVQRLGDLRNATEAGHAVVGSELPATIILHALTPVPEDLARKYPELRGTGFARAAAKVLVVDLDNSLVVGVLGG